MLNVLHISDLHFSATKTSIAHDAANAASNGIIRLATKLKEQGIIGPNPCLCLTGDIVQSGGSSVDGAQSDFDAVQSEFLAPLMKILQIGPERVFIVPGNHEIEREAVAESDRIHCPTGRKELVTEHALKLDLRKKLRNFFQFVEKNSYNSVTYEEPRIARYSIDDKEIVCLNGLVGSYSRPKIEDKGELFILPSERAGALAEIPDFSVVLTHHPLAWFDDQSAGDLRALLQARRCRLLTGHIHDKGVFSIKSIAGSIVVIEAGASAEIGDEIEVAVAWLPNSDSAAVRHYSFDPRTGDFPPVPADETQVAPEEALKFFKSTAAFFDPKVIEEGRRKAREFNVLELEASSGRGFSNFIPPDIELYQVDEFATDRISFEKFVEDRNNFVISGDELSGKTSLLHYYCAVQNGRSEAKKIYIYLDFRAFDGKLSISEIIIKTLVGFELTKQRAEQVLASGLVHICVDNFESDRQAFFDKLLKFFSENENVTWAVAVKGSQRFMPSSAPASFPEFGISYYELSEVTLPTVLSMIKVHKEGPGVQKPREVVERVFRSVNNLRAPRTVFYVSNLVDIFLNDASAEPLNRYLLIENLLQDKIRHAHRVKLPNQPVDMTMLESFIGVIAHFLHEHEQAFLSKADYYSIADAFIKRKGILSKNFDPDTLLEILVKSFVLREYPSGYGFMMMSIEDYYLAKHMTGSIEFRDKVMSPQGLLDLPSVAEYYVAQNPSDRDRIDCILQVIEKFEIEARPLVDAIGKAARGAIETAFPGTPPVLHNDLLEELVDLSKGESDSLVLSGGPTHVGSSNRIRFDVEEKGAILLQLGASILGLTRTLDQSERIEIFKRLRSVLSFCIVGVPVMAQYLAEGNEVTIRGTVVKANYTGVLKDPKNRFYIILRGMIYGLVKTFGTWSGSPSFFSAAKELRLEEEDEFVKTALFAQNIESDLSEAIAFIEEIPASLKSPVLREIAIRLYRNALSLVPLDSVEQNRAINALADVLSELSPPKNANRRGALQKNRDQIRKDIEQKIGVSMFAGRLVKSRKSPRR